MATKTKRAAKIKRAAKKRHVPIPHETAIALYKLPQLIEPIPAKPNIGPPPTLVEPVPDKKRLALRTLSQNDYDSFIVDSSYADPAAAINNAYAQGYVSVRVVTSIVIKSAIRMPDYTALYSEGPLYVTKGYSGPMMIMGSWADMHGLRFEGAGDVYDGAGILCEANTARQEMSMFRVMRSRGPAIDMSAYAAGAYSSIGGGSGLCMLQRYDLTLPAIVLPGDEPGTTGVRRLISLSGGGGKLIDLGGSNMSMMQNCDTYRLAMAAGCRYAQFTNNRFAIPVGEGFYIHGSNHRFSGNTTSQNVHFAADAIGCAYDDLNYDAGAILDYGTQYNKVGHMLLVPRPINNSGNTTNVIQD